MEYIEYEEEEETPISVRKSSENKLVSSHFQGQHQSRFNKKEDPESSPS